MNRSGEMVKTRCGSLRLVKPTSPLQGIKEMNKDETTSFEEVSGSYEKVAIDLASPREKRPVTFEKVRTDYYL